MADEFLSDLPEDDPLPAPTVASFGEASKIELKSMNTNLGAQRMALPRNMALVMARIDQSAQISGAKWRYSIPFKDKRTGKTTLVTGPTIGCALDIARAYGNCTVDVERVEDLKDGWVFYAVFLDIENGFRLGRPFRQRRGQNVGGYGGDQGRAEDVVFQSGASKALRNVTTNALRGIVDEALDRADARLTDKISKNREHVLARVFDRLTELNIEEARVERFIGRKFAEMKPMHIAQVIKLLQSIADDMITPDEAFPRRGAHDTGDLREVRAADDAGEGEEGNQEFAKGGDEASRRGREDVATNVADAKMPRRDAPQGTREAPRSGREDTATNVADTKLPARGAPEGTGEAPRADRIGTAANAAGTTLSARGAPEGSPRGRRQTAASAAPKSAPRGDEAPPTEPKRPAPAPTAPARGLPDLPTDDGWPDVGDEPLFGDEPPFGDEQ